MTTTLHILPVFADGILVRKDPDARHNLWNERKISKIKEFHQLSAQWYIVCCLWNTGALEIIKTWKVINLTNIGCKYWWIMKRSIHGYGSHKRNICLLCGLIIYLKETHYGVHILVSNISYNQIQSNVDTAHASFLQWILSGKHQMTLSHFVFTQCAWLYIV